MESVYKWTLKLFALIVFVSVPNVLYAQAEEIIEKTETFVRNGNVTIETISGDIRVKNWQHDDVKITAIKKARKKDDLEKISMEVVRHGSVLEIKRKDKNALFSKRASASIHFTVWVPENTSLDVQTVSGDISINGNSGKVKAVTVSGEIRIEECDQKTWASSTSGDIMVISNNGALDAQTVSGNIKVSGCKEGLRAGTVSGPVELENTAGRADVKSVSGDVEMNGHSGSVQVSVVSGDIQLQDILVPEQVNLESTSGELDYRGELNKGSDFKMQSHSGDIRMTIPQTHGFNLSVSTFSGEIELGFPITIEGKMEARKLKGTFGNGDSEIEISTFSGDINLRNQ